MGSLPAEKWRLGGGVVADWEDLDLGGNCDAVQW